MSTLRSVRELCEEYGIGLPQLAEKTGLEEKRLRAIVEGRWTPSPSERERLAGAFGLAKDDIAWGHQTPVQHLYGHGPQFGRTP
jgi:transcriptional regulator with XRE-family HTH domain